MKDISYFFNTLEISDISLLGYSFKNERIKDEIISKIPHVEIEEIDSSFSFKTYLREEKLKYIFDVSDKSDVPKWFVLDINNITSKLLIDKVKLIKNVLNGIRNDMYYSTEKSPDTSTQKPFYRLLITCPLQRTSSDFDIHSFSGGNTPIYISDFVCTIDDDINLNVLKNRYEHIDKKISLDNLKDYTYICNYENCQ
jgi:hypothetical protein